MGVIRLKKHTPCLSFWLLNSAVLYLATVVCPVNFELGNFWLSKTAAAFLAGFWLTILVWLAKPAITKLKIKLKGREKMFLFYWFCNFVAIWVVARFAPFTGFGISRYYWAIGLAFVLNFAQWLLWQYLKKAELVKCS